MLSDFFKPEDRKRGEDLLGKDAVVVASKSDTGVRAFIKGSAACKVSFSTEDVSSPAFAADRTCTSARKGILCKHIWAVVLKIAGSDFLEAKTEIAKAAAPAANPARTASNERQAEYRKQQYVKQKARAKEMRRDKKPGKPEAVFSYPEPVEEARSYFSENGFTLEHPLDLGVLLNAKKLLSRVFHPDKGGTHEESVLLNENFEIIYSYLKE